MKLIFFCIKVLKFEIWYDLNFWIYV
jgi:hypothetical protein